MADTIAQLLVRISADIGDLRSELDDATGALEGFARNAESASGSVFNSLRMMATFTGAQLLADGIRSVTSAFIEMGKSAIESVAYAERMDMAFTSLLAKEIAQASGVEKTIVVGQQRIALTEKELAQLDDLREKIQDDTLRRNLLAAQMQEQRQRIIELTAQYGAEGLAVQTANARLAQMEDQLGDLDAAISKNSAKVAELEGKQGALVTVTKTVREGQISISEAMGQASEKAAELVRWSQQLAVLSPFSRKDVDNALRLAMAYGFTSEEAKRLTQATMDFAAGTGASGEAINRIALALGQIQSRGKLAGQEMMQLTEAGVSVRQILADAFGVSTAQLEEMISKGLVPADKAIEAIIGSMEKDFGGAAKAQANTFSGLLSSLGDLKEVGLREFFEGAFMAAKPFLESFVDTLSSPETMAAIAGIGQQFGAMVTQVLGWLSAVIPKIQAFGQSILTWATTALPPVIAAIQQFIAQAGAFIAPIVQAISQFVSWQDVLTALGLLIGSVVVPALGALIAAIAPVVAGAALLVGAVALVRQAWENDWGGIRTALTEFWNNTALPILQQLVAWLAQNLPIAIQALSAFWTSTLLPALQAVWAFIRDYLIPLWVAVEQVGFATVRVGIRAVAGLFQNVLLPALGDVWEFVGKKVTPIFTGLADTFSLVAEKIQALTGWLKDLANRLSSLTLPDWMTPGSPTPWEIGLTGVADAMHRLSRVELPRLESNLALAPAQAAPVNNFRFTVYGNVGDAGIFRDAVERTRQPDAHLLAALVAREVAAEIRRQSAGRREVR